MPQYYEFEVALRGIKPRIWRRFQLRSTATFEQLHRAIQDAFGWEYAHLWEFREPDRRAEPIAGPPDEFETAWADEDAPDATRVAISADFRERAIRASTSMTLATTGITWFGYADSSARTTPSNAACSRASGLAHRRTAAASRATIGVWTWPKGITRPTRTSKIGSPAGTPTHSTSPSKSWPSRADPSRRQSLRRTIGS